MLHLLLVLMTTTAAAPVPTAPHHTTTASTTASTPSLLILRAACFTTRPEEHFARPAEEYTAITGYTIKQVLSYQETCGAGWRSPRLGGRSRVVAAGALGGSQCATLAAAGTRVVGGGCAQVAARSRALAHLAVALGWRRALLLPATHCGPAAAADAVAALLAQGLAIAWMTTDYWPFQPDVVVMVICGSTRVPEAAAVRTAGAWGATLLLLAIPREEAAADVDDHSEELAISTGNISNFNLAVNVMPYLQKRENSMLSSSQVSEKLSVYYSADTVTSPPNHLVGIVTSGPNKTQIPPRKEIGNDSMRSSESEANGPDPKTTTGKLLNNDTLTEKQTNYANEAKADSTFDEDDFSSASAAAASLGGRVLLLSGAAAAEARPEPLTTVLRRLALPPSATHNYTLYEPAATGPASWRPLADLLVRSTTVELINASPDLSLWTVRGTTKRGRIESSIFEISFLFAVIGIYGVLIFLFVYMFGRQTRRWCLRMIEGYRHGGGSGGGACGRGGEGGGGRRRGSAVLSAAHFQFPAEETARIDSGMESMLSCWLQRLHEFGGPELPPPANAATAAAAAAATTAAGPHASQPSSTCSITRLATDKRTTYKGDPVIMKYLEVSGELELKRKALDVLFTMRNIHHENLNPFIGCLCGGGGDGAGTGGPRAALVWAHGGRGTLEDVLVADDIRLDWTFRLSLLTDLVRGMRHLQASPLRIHGRLSSRSCVVDARWVLRIGDYGAGSFERAQGLPRPRLTARDLLWTAPELLRVIAAAATAPSDEPRATQPGDVFSFGIIMQEVIVRGEPYCMLSLTPEEIVEKLMRPPPLIRPSVSMAAAPPEAVRVMRQCWSEAPDARPDFEELYDIFRQMHRGRKINIVDSMFEMLEKYSNNLEELIKERTDQLDIEKKKTEQLLNRMLPRSVAERLLLGSPVEPEEFEEVSIYFSDIVGFTELAARSSPVQVVDLLNDLYTSFDAAIEQHRVYKVETIGDAYMVVGGLPVRCADHAERVATMALHLLHVAGRFRIRHLPARPLHVRIGLHSGPCCAGVVGRTMPRYCLFGDTVNTAARMESTGAAWRVQVSTRTARRLAAVGGYRLRERGRLRIKGKGVMRTYWLLGKDGFDKPLPTPPPLEKEDALLEAEHEQEESQTKEVEPLDEEDLLDKMGLVDEDGATETEGETTVPTDFSFASERHGWQRSGTLSADSSPPLRARSAVTPAAPDEFTVPYSRYRCSSAGGGGARVLRRQWSLERGEALAAACVRPAPPSVLAPPSPVPPSTPAVPPPPPLALQAAPARPAPPRYRTRSDAVMELTALKH